MFATKILVNIKIYPVDYDNFILVTKVKNKTKIYIFNKYQWVNFFQNEFTLR